MSRARPTTRRDPGAAQAADGEPDVHADPVHRRPDDHRRGRVRAARSRATTTPTARTAKSPGSTGRCPAAWSGHLELTKRLLALRASSTRRSPVALLLGSAGGEGGRKDLSWMAPHGGEMTDADWYDGSPDHRPVPGRRRTPSDRCRGQRADRQLRSSWLSTRRPRRARSRSPGPPGPPPTRWSSTPTATWSPR